MIPINGKYIKNIGVQNSFEKNETATMFFLRTLFFSFGIVAITVTHQFALFQGC